ncbi:MAG: PAS domain S-box protein, partial [Woeseia sp.]
PGGSKAQILGMIHDLSELRLSEYQRDRFFELTADIMAILSEDGRIIRSNPAAERILGFSGKELTSTPYTDFVHPDDRARTLREKDKMLGNESSELLDVRLRTKDGGYRDTRWNAVLWPGTGMIIASGRDVTSIRQAEKTLQERDIMMRRGEQLTSAGSWLWEIGSPDVRTSSGMNEILGIQEASDHIADYEQMLTFIIEGDREEIISAIERAARDGELSRRVCRVRRRDGKERILQSFVDAARRADGTIYGVLGCSVDITEFREALQQLQQSESQLRALTRKLEAIRDEEQTHISREIHDELGQLMTALKIDLNLLGQSIVEDSKPLPDAASVRNSLKSMERLVDSTIESVRRIARQLRPEMLDSLGLVPAIEFHAKEFEARTGINCAVASTDGLPKLPGHVASAIFRIVQEAMTNVARHADASRITVTMSAAADCLQLTIEDNGRGIDTAKLGGATLGLLGMRERANMIDADIDIRGER